MRQKDAERVDGILRAGPVSLRAGATARGDSADVTFAYITGWRIASEVLPLEWRQEDFEAGEVRLDAGTTKNNEGRVFVMTDDLRALLKAEHAEHERLKKAGHTCPYVFFRMVAEKRGGEKKPRRVKAFTKAWKNACRAAGCPGRIPHDLRRTAVRNMVRVGIPERVAMKHDRRRSLTERAIFFVKLEAPPGFEPGMEVLQISKGSLS